MTTRKQLIEEVGILLKSLRYQEDCEYEWADQVIDLIDSEERATDADPGVYDRVVSPAVRYRLIIEQRNGTRWVLEEARIEPQPGATVSDRDMYAVTITPVRGRAYGPDGEILREIAPEGAAREKNRKGWRP